MKIRQAVPADLDSVLPLFIAYREFYRLPPDAAKARSFLEDRFQRKESVIFLAYLDTPIGFTQIYPSFSSGALAPILILNDLFVSPEARRKGVGLMLLEAAAEYGKHAGAARLTLSTEMTNTPAQSLYEKAGWRPDTTFRVYHLSLNI